MSLFSGLSKAVKKASNFLEDKILEPISKDIIPAGAAYLTGGQSLAFIPPSDSGALSGLSNSIFGVNAGDLAENLLGGANKSTQERTEYVTAQAERPVLQQQQLYQSLTPSVKSTSDLASSPQVGNNAPQVSGGGLNTQSMMMIGGAIGALALILLMGKKK